MELWQAAVLGLVEGITEYLPVSSTGHLILAGALLGLDNTEAGKRALDDFDIIIQGGAILAVLGLYWPTCVRMVKGLLGKDPRGFVLFVNLCIAFVPAAAIGLLTHKWIKTHLFHAGPVLLALAMGGFYMMLVEQWRKGRFGLTRAQTDSVFDVTPRQAFIVGLFQVASLIPGTSRSMMTITGGMFAGMRARTAAEFSFLLGLPTLLAATLFSLWKDLKESWQPHGPPNIFQQFSWQAVAVGVLVAAVSAAVAVKWLVAFLNRHGLTGFGWYRVGLAVVLGLAFLTGIVQMREAEAKPAAQGAGSVGQIEWEKPAK